jgi:hypothetical protein
MGILRTLEIVNIVKIRRLIPYGGNKRYLTNRYAVYPKHRVTMLETKGTFSNHLLIDTGMSYTRVLHIKFAYCVPHK